MAGIAINRITNANIYLDGYSLLGQAESIDLPDIKNKMSDHKALGLVGTPEFPSGLEKLSAKIKWNSYYPESLLSSANPTQTVQLQARGSVETWSSAGRVAEVPLVCMMTGLFIKQPMGKFTPNENVGLESDLAVYYAAMTIDGQEIMEIDVLANIWYVAGNDVLLRYRMNVGG